jgi:ribosomal protein S18 acetylase RimI-like enzyme
MIRLRPAEKADLTQLYDLDRICFPVGIAYSLRDFRALLRSSRVLTIIAEEDSVLTGFAMAQVATHDRIRAGIVVTIDVAPHFRRRGVGESLMHAIEAGVRAAGGEILRLEVAVDNETALSFYAKLDFKAIGEIPGYYHTGMDAIVMEKPLRP